jgi:hypothetical protein
LVAEDLRDRGGGPRRAEPVILTTKMGPGMTQKLAQARLRPARFRPVSKDHRAEERMLSRDCVGADQVAAYELILPLHQVVYTTLSKSNS